MYLHNVFFRWTRFLSPKWSIIFLSICILIIIIINIAQLLSNAKLKTPVGVYTILIILYKLNGYWLNILLPQREIKVKNILLNYYGFVRITSGNFMLWFDRLNTLPPWYNPIKAGFIIISAHQDPEYSNRHQYCTKLNKPEKPFTNCRFRLNLKRATYLCTDLHTFSTQREFQALSFGERKWRSVSSWCGPSRGMCTL